MKEIEKKEAPGVAGGYRDNGGCIPGPLPLPLPGDAGSLDPYPRAPVCPYAEPEPWITDPPAV